MWRFSQARARKGGKTQHRIPRHFFPESFFLLLELISPPYTKKKTLVTSTSQRLRDEFAFLLFSPPPTKMSSVVLTISPKTEIWGFLLVSRLSSALFIYATRACRYDSLDIKILCESERATVLPLRWPQRLWACVRARRLRNDAECVREEGADARNVYFFFLWNRLLKWEKCHGPSSSL